MCRQSGREGEPPATTIKNKKQEIVPAKPDMCREATGREEPPATTIKNKKSKKYVPAKPDMCREATMSAKSMELHGLFLC